MGARVRSGTATFTLGRMKIKLWCLVQLILAALISAAPQNSRDPDNRFASEGNGIVNFERNPNLAQFLPVIRNAIVANRNRGVAQDGEDDLSRGPLINLLDAVLGTA